MNSLKAAALVKFKYIFYSSLLKINSDNKKFISKKIFYGSLLIGLLNSCQPNSSSSFRATCHDSIAVDTLKKDSIKKLVAEAKKADSLNALRIEDSLKKDSILKSESKKHLNKKHK